VTFDFTTMTDYVKVWSPHLNQPLLVVSGPSATSFGQLVAGRVDLNGDGLPDLVVASPLVPNTEIAAYDHSGTLLYRIPLAQLNVRVMDLCALPDLDGDGCSEFLVGAFDYNLGYTRGLVAVVSGRTGRLLRISYDQVQGDLIGYPITTVGDMDGDGVMDYATGDYWGHGRAVLTVYSGATAAILHEWVASYDNSSVILGGHDIDLDGVPDVIGVSLGYLNSTGYAGRLQAFSSRDQQVLFHTEPTTSVVFNYAHTLADLGVQPGSPYPVIAF